VNVLERAASAPTSDALPARPEHPPAPSGAPRPVPSVPRLVLLAAALAVAALSARPAAADVVVPKWRLRPPETLDTGVYRVWSGDRAVGFETFSYVLQNDSLVIGSYYRQPLRGGDTLRKSVMLAVTPLDYDLRFYQSTFTVPGDKVVRGLSFGDTVFTAYHERKGQGEGVTYQRPPGRLYALESTAFVLFDIMCRSLAKRSFETWNLNVFVFGSQDTLLRVVARDLGPESLRWGNAPVTARKLVFDDGSTEFHAWIGPGGDMLRLEQPATALRAEREPPPARRAGRKPSDPED
jgi:hypothetical protein